MTARSYNVGKDFTVSLGSFPNWNSSRLFPEICEKAVEHTPKSMHVKKVLLSILLCE
jgi:hypothetical protein